MASLTSCQHLALLNDHNVRFDIRLFRPPNVPSGSCRIEVNLNYKLLLDEPCRSTVSIVVSMQDAEGWHELEVAVLEPVYASVSAFKCLCINSAIALPPRVLQINT